MHQPGGWVGVQEVVRCLLEESVLGVEGRLHNVVKEVLEEAAAIHPSLRLPKLVHKLHPHPPLEPLTQAVESVEAVLYDVVPPNGEECVGASSHGLSVLDFGPVIKHQDLEDPGPLLEGDQAGGVLQHSPRAAGGGTCAAPASPRRQGALSLSRKAVVGKPLRQKALWRCKPARGISVVQLPEEGAAGHLELVPYRRCLRGPPCRGRSTVCPQQLPQRGLQKLQEALPRRIRVV
mmetsp:Transcript_3436/g.9879  ORF Transcript_3436/g.9879 Transcript_3436/m.9879 type:complete len:234 (+) Transcript_3436:1147-1848(+)